MAENNTVLNFSDDDEDTSQIDQENIILNDNENFKKNILDLRLSHEIRIKLIFCGKNFKK